MDELTLAEMDRLCQEASERIQILRGIVLMQEPSHKYNPLSADTLRVIASMHKLLRFIQDAGIHGSAEAFLRRKQFAHQHN